MNFPAKMTLFFQLSSTKGMNFITEHCGDRNSYISQAGSTSAVGNGVGFTDMAVILIDHF